MSCARVDRRRLRRASSHAPQAFTIVEATISTIVVAVMLVAALNTVGASKATQQRAILVSRGQLLAEALMTEILEQDYQDPDGTPAFGLETGESSPGRTAYDDVDDYHGWTSSPPVARDGTTLTNAANWTRTVTVERIDPLDPSTVAAAETGAKRITVTVLYGNVPQAKLVALRTRGGAVSGEQEAAQSQTSSTTSSSSSKTSSSPMSFK